MTVENAFLFLEQALTDKNLQAAIEQATSGRSPRAAAVAMAGVGRKNGFDFQADDLLEVRSCVRAGMMQAGTMDGELSDEDLSKVAGGLPLVHVHAQTAALDRASSMLEQFQATRRNGSMNGKAALDRWLTAQPAGAVSRS